MSYCRWSSMNGMCDVYCYAHINGGYMLHVASNRLINDPPEMPEYDEDKPNIWLDAHRERMEWYGKEAKRTKIGLSHDGETFSLDTAKQAAATLILLRDEGYNVPQYAIDQLLEEWKEENED